MKSEDDITHAYDLGPCCACGRTGASVRNLIALDRKAPIPGRGWGCLQCGLRRDGAQLVVCDACFGDGVGAIERCTMACRGYPGTDGRVPIEELCGDHIHDLAKHPEMAGEQPIEQWPTDRRAAECASDSSSDDEPIWRDDGDGGVICQHGHAMDTHCCQCHSGFVFDGMQHEAPCLLAEDEDE